MNKIKTSLIQETMHKFYINKINQIIIKITKKKLVFMHKNNKI
jgi:hypothetical protein